MKGDAATIEEQTEWRVVLLDVGPQRVAVMKVLRELLNLPLRETKALVDAPPVAVGEDLDREAAEHLHERLLAAGAAAEVR
jgi:large subunit ribosomal protein L7/L12